MNNIPERLKLIRDKIIQFDFAARIGLSQRTLSRYEAGSGSPDAKTLQRICYLFGISPQWLLFGSGPMISEEPVLSKEAMAMIGEDVFCNNPMHQPVKCRSEIMQFDPVVLLVDEVMEDMGITLTEKQKKALVDIMREELTTRATNIARAIKGE